MLSELRSLNAQILGAREVAQSIAVELLAVRDDLRFVLIQQINEGRPQRQCA